MNHIIRDALLAMMIALEALTIALAALTDAVKTCTTWYAEQLRMTCISADEEPGP